MYIERHGVAVANNSDLRFQTLSSLSRLHPLPYPKTFINMTSTVSGWLIYQNTYALVSTTVSIVVGWGLGGIIW